MISDNPEKLRTTVIESIDKILGLPSAMSRNIEKSIFNYSIDKAQEYKIIKRWDNPFFVQIYLDKFKMIYFTIKKDEIKEKIKIGLLITKDLAYKTHQEIYPEKWKQMMDNKKIRLENKYFPKIEASTDNFECRRCKKNRCTYYQAQTRSADEPMTVFIQCLNCGKEWRQ